MIRTSTLHLYTPFSHCNMAWGMARIVLHRLFDICIVTSACVMLHSDIKKKKKIFIINHIIEVL